MEEVPNIKAPHLLKWNHILKGGDYCKEDEMAEILAIPPIKEPPTIKRTEKVQIEAVDGPAVKTVDEASGKGRGKNTEVPDWASSKMVGEADTPEWVEEPKESAPEPKGPKSTLKRGTDWK